MTNAGTLVSLLFLGWLLYRQVQVRPVPRQPRLGRPLLFLGLGLLLFLPFLAGRPRVPGSCWAVLAASFVVGAGLGVARAYTVRLWFADRRLLRQGTWLTVVLWLVAVGLHACAGLLVVRIGGPAELMSTTGLLYLAMALLVQQVALARRGERRRARARAAVAAMRAEGSAPGAAMGEAG